MIVGIIWMKIDREYLTLQVGIDFKLVTDNSLPFERNQFDMIMLNDVLEHLHDSPYSV